MIQNEQGNLIKAEAEALVNTVNCVGIMGKGIALQFRQAFPENFKAYQRACKAEEVQLGKMFVVPTRTLTNPLYIINFPTKQHWRGKSRLEDIKSGLVALIEEVKQREIHSIALPPLGCGNGGLDWAEVKPLIEKAFEAVPEVAVLLFAPQPEPEADKMPIATKKVKLTRARALLIRLIELYRRGEGAYRLGLLEVQKLSYFLQEAGEPLKLKYTKDKFGPYADNLNHVLQYIEGHYTRGYGDRRQRAEIYLLPNALEEADRFLQQEESPEAWQRLERVCRLIEGFETPLSMELLATVHWVATREDPQAAQDKNIAIAKVQEWNERKRKNFKSEYIAAAWQRLHDEKWLTRD